MQYVVVWVSVALLAASVLIAFLDINIETGGVVTINSVALINVIALILSRVAIRKLQFSGYFYLGVNFANTICLFIVSTLDSFQNETRNSVELFFRPTLLFLTTILVIFSAYIFYKI